MSSRRPATSIAERSATFRLLAAAIVACLCCGVGYAHRDFAARYSARHFAVCPAVIPGIAVDARCSCLSGDRPPGAREGGDVCATDATDNARHAAGTSRVSIFNFIHAFECLPAT